MPKGKCAECGFLTAHSTKAQFVELGIFLRQDGVLLDSHTSDHLCFVLAGNPIEGCLPTDSEVFLKMALHKERECDCYTPYVQGHAPKEHYEFMQRNILQESAAKAAAAQRDWQAAQKADDREWQRKQKREDRFWQFVLLIIGLAAGYFFGIRK